MNNYYLNLPITQHFEELRIRVYYIIGSFISTALTAYYYSEQILYIIAKPLLYTLSNTNFIFTNLSEVFIIYIKMATSVSIYLCLPVLFYQIWMFLVSGLYENENRFLKFIFILSIFLIIVSIVIAYYIIFPIACKFFVNFEFGTATAAYQSPVSIHLEAKVNEYVLLILKSLFLFTLAFQFPVFIIIITYFEIISINWFVNKRRYFILLAFIIAALLSPPDLLSQVLLVIPILSIYEILVFSFKLYFNYKK